MAQTSALSDIAYRSITRKLMASELIVGQKLSEQKIAAECGISRTPVREAVRRLIEEGVLYQIPCSGTYVARLDRRQLIDAPAAALTRGYNAIELAQTGSLPQTATWLELVIDPAASETATL